MEIQWEDHRNMVGYIGNNDGIIPDGHMDMLGRLFGALNFRTMPYLTGHEVISNDNQMITTK